MSHLPCHISEMFKQNIQVDLILQSPKHGSLDG